MRDSESGFSTRSIHSGTVTDTIGQGTSTPIFPSSVTRYPNPSGTIYYPRYNNSPNQDALGDKIAALEGAEEGLVLGSGMAAISCALLTFLKTGDHAIFQEGLYGGTQNFVYTEFPKLGIEYTVVESLDPEEYRRAVRPNTRLIFIESPTNPLLKVIDIAAIASVSRAHNLVSVIDNTFASPVNQTPISLGIDIVMHSATKYLNGHSDLCAGFLVCTAEKMHELRKTALNYGGHLPPQACYLLERGMKTLAVRVNAHNANALTFARYLKEEFGIQKVNYPGLESHPGHAVAKRQMRGFGGMLSADMELGTEGSVAFMKHLRVFVPAVSLGGVESIVCRPCETSHVKISPEIRLKQGITDSLMRFSVGIEDIGDLLEDVTQAYRRVTEAAGSRR